jgi:hypothetical protein
VGKARAAVPVLATLATDLERESLKVAGFVRNAVQKAWAFVGSEDLREIKIDRKRSAAAVVSAVLLGTVFAYSAHTWRKNHADEAAPQASVERAHQGLFSSELKTAAEQNRSSGQGSSSVLATIPPGGDGQTVRTFEVDFSERADTASGTKPLSSDISSTNEVTSSQMARTQAVEDPKAGLDSAAPVPSLARATGTQSKLRTTSRLISAHPTKPVLAAVSQTRAADSSMDGLTALGVRPDLSAALLSAATPESASKPAATIEKQKAAGSQPEVTENYLEVASFNDSTWADKAVDQLTQLGFHAAAIHRTHLWMQAYHVRVGPYANVPDMEAAEKSLAKLGFKSHPAK